MNSYDPADDSILIPFRRQLRVLEREVIRELEAQTSCCGVTVAQCHVLLELAGATLSLSGLAGALGLDPSTLSRTVDSLVKAGLVERTEDPSDRRSLRLVLTPAGEGKVRYIDETCNRTYAHLLAGMTAEDREHVVRGVALMAERMGAHPCDEPCGGTCATGGAENGQSAADAY
jgi:DNA-binding MarR family transcriptional regulator